MNLNELKKVLVKDALCLHVSKNDSSATTGVWKVFFNPRFLPVIIIRISRYCYLSKYLKLLSPLFTWINVIIFGIECTPRCDIGEGICIPHSVGTVIGAAKIGKNVTIFQGVTVGAKFADLSFTNASRPVIHDYVTIGAGAKVLGGIVIGSNVKIAPNCVVLGDIDDGALVSTASIVKT